MALIIVGIFFGKCGVQGSDNIKALSYSHGVYEAVHEGVLVKDRTTEITPFLTKVQTNLK
jgi:hypothetical protein